MVEWIRIPLINANEEEVEITEIYVEEGQKVGKGDALFEIESTKATVVVEAPREGFLRRINAKAGQRVMVGAVFAALSTTLEEEIPDAPQVAGQEAPLDPDAPRATKRARELATEYGLSLEEIPHRGIITERDLRAAIEQSGDPDPGRRKRQNGSTATRETRQGSDLCQEEILIYGAGGHAQVVLEMLRASRPDLRIIGCIDDDPHGPDDLFGIPLLGSSERLPELRERGVRYAALGIGAVTRNGLRSELYERLRSLGFRLPAIIHPRAAVESSAQIGMGAQIFAGAVVSSAAVIGENAIVNSNVVVSHDCQIGAHVHLTPGAILAGGVTVGERSVIGMGVTLYLGVTIGADVTIANGNHILQDVQEERFIRHQ